jgi:hypothetical protein
MSYSVVQNKTGSYDILEKESETLIELNRSETDVRILCRKLNLGSGFNGWTPGFFSKKTNVLEGA